MRRPYSEFSKDSFKSPRRMRVELGMQRRLRRNQYGKISALHSRRAKAEECPHCNGAGVVQRLDAGKREITQFECGSCRGTGRGKEISAARNGSLKDYLPTILITLLLIGVMMFFLWAIGKLDPPTLDLPRQQAQTRQFPFRQSPKLCFGEMTNPAHPRALTWAISTSRWRCRNMAEVFGALRAENSREFPLMAVCRTFQ